ncbi:MAG: hypothetical protein VX346_19600 [Planctomycetota bacterium]|nr:hypothetical protein [Planctomycetota bacterium]
MTRSRLYQNLVSVHATYGPTASRFYDSVVIGGTSGKWVITWR